MIRILHIGLVGIPGGIESCVLGYYRWIDQEKFCFDFVDVYGEGRVASIAQIQKQGGKVFTISDCRKDVLRSSYELFTLLRKEKYDIIHIHLLSAARIVLPLICCIASNTAVIVHCHSSSTPSGMLRKSLHFMNRYILRMLPVQKWACGMKAGKWLWGSRFDPQNVICNAIDYSHFKPDMALRKIMREKCGFQKTNIVVGFVGFLCEAKNVLFLPEILSELLKTKGIFRLLIVGDGDYREKLFKKIDTFGLKEFVYWAGMQEDAAPWYQAMDAFVLPSLFEGLPTVGIEAQACELPCFVSDCVSDEVNITERVNFLPIDQGAEVWQKKMIEVLFNTQATAKKFSPSYKIADATVVLEEKYVTVFHNTEKHKHLQ